MLDAPICWMGGKSKLRFEIIRRLPRHTCYVEVFGGAGWVLFAKEPSHAEVYNDLDGELVNFFRVVKNAHRAFVLALDWILISRRMFDDFLRTKPEDLNEIQRAVRFFYVIKTAFGGKWEGSSFGYSKTQGPTMNIETVYETLTAVHKRLRRVVIEEGSFEEVIGRYDGPETCFFLDPPYYGTAGYRVPFGPSEYARLAEVLRGIRGKFLLTVNDCPETRELFGKWKIEEALVSYSIAGKAEARGKYGELMVMNYEGEGQMELGV